MERVSGSSENIIDKMTSTSFFSTSISTKLIKNFTQPLRIAVWVKWTIVFMLILLPIIFTVVIAVINNVPTHSILLFFIVFGGSFVLYRGPKILSIIMFQSFVIVCLIMLIILCFAPSLFCYHLPFFIVGVLHSFIIRCYMFCQYCEWENNAWICRQEQKI